MDRITASDVRYIKLGPGGAWAGRCRELSEMRVGFRSVPHDLCLAGDWDAVRQVYLAEGMDVRTAGRFATELREFYELGPDTLWITFENDRLWWGFAEVDVEWVEDEEGYAGARRRRMRGGWSCLDLAGNELRKSALGSRLTRVAGYRQTICSVADVPLLLRRLSAERSDLLIGAEAAKAAMRDAAGKMIAALDWGDFEALTDLIFARGGWQRVSMLGGTLKTVDLVLRQPVTGEQAAVQVKSKANATTFADAVARMTAEGHDHVFFVCHTPQGRFVAPERISVADPKVHVWTGEALADAALGAGLYDWLVERSG